MDQLIKGLAPVAAAVAISCFALPSYIGVLRQRGVGRGLVLLLALGALLIGIMVLSVKTGLPYGKFSFNDSLGYKVLGAVPWTIAFAYTPLLLAAFWLASKVTTRLGRIFLTPIFALIMHLVIDPALVRMTLWKWETVGQFYGVPLLSFGVWAGVWLIATVLLAKLWDEVEPRRSLAYSGFAILWFWAGVNLGLQQWVPGGVGIGFGLLVLILMWIEKRREKKSAD